MTMIRLAFRGIRASIGRLILTTIAIVGGVGFVAGSFILADSLTETFTALFDSASSEVDASIQLAELDFGTDERTIPDSLVDEVAALPEVDVATPEVTYGQADSQAPFVVLDENGDRIDNVGPPIITFSWNGDTGELISIAEGEPPSGSDEFAIDSVYATQAGVEVGDQIMMATPDGTREFTVATIIDFEITGGAWFVLFDFETAQELYDKEGEVDAISLNRATGVTTEEMIAAVTDVVPDGVEVLNQAELADEQSAQFEQIINVLRNVLLAFAGIALFVSLFIIYNTFAILVSQRLQQIGMLRAIGATKGQIRVSVIIEALIVGIAGSIIGIAFGLVVAFLIKSAFSAGGGFPDTNTVIAPRTIIVSLLVGLVATIISALLPAMLAGRVTPIAAMRNEAPGRSSRTRRIGFGAVVLTVGLVLLTLGLLGTSETVAGVLTLLATGAVLTFVGVAMLSVLFAGPVVNLLGRPWVLGASLLLLGIALPLLTFTIGDGVPSGPVSTFTFILKMAVSLVAAITGLSILATVSQGGRPVGLGGSAAGLEGRLARQNASRSPQRTAATATALTIGIALVSTVGVVGESIKASFIDTVDNAINADLFIYSETGGLFPGQLANDVEQVDGIEEVSRFRVNQVRLAEAETEAEEDDVVGVAAFNSSTGTAIIDFEVTEGSLGGLEDNGVLVFADEAADRDLEIGSVVPAEFPDGEFEDLTVVGIFEDNAVITNVNFVVDLDIYERHITADDDAFVGATIAEGLDPDPVKQEVVDLTGDYSGATAQDNQEYVETIEGQVDGIITLINYLLAFALVIAFLGVINTIVLSVIERTREIGLLRAVGMTRGQTRAAIRWEAVIVCLFGALLGIVLGVLFAWAAVSAIPDNIISSVSIPYESIMFAILVAALAGVVAALLPARRAARLEVLDAIATGGG